MSKRSRDMAAVGVSFDVLRIGWLTWIGLCVAGLGWLLLIGLVMAADLVIAKSPHPLPPTLRADAIDLTRLVVVSGFGLAIVGALQTGFGTLNRFFGAVLTRSSQRDAEPRASEPIAEPVVAPAPAAKARRPYRMLPDGSVEVETILGTRLFKTMTEARDFI